MMLVNRRTFKIKRGCSGEAVELVKAEAKRHVAPHAFRLYVPRFGPFDVLILEWEFESLEEHERFWAEWRAPEAATFLEKWFTLTEAGETNEIWDLAE